MNAAVKEKNRIGKAIRRLCPIRHGLLAAGGLLALLYHAHKGDKTLMQRISEGFTQPFHRLMARLTGAVPFSVAELLYALLILFLLITCRFRSLGSSGNHRKGSVHTGCC